MTDTNERTPSVSKLCQLLGPEFRPVDLTEHVPDPGLWPITLVDDLTDYRSVRRIAGRAWAITDHGQSVMGWEPGADQAYLEWLLVQCDRVIDGDQADRREALDAFWWINWDLLEGELREQVAVAILVALSETDWISVGKPHQKAKTVFLTAARKVSTPKGAARVTRALRAMGPKKFDQWRRTIRNELRNRRGLPEKQSYLSAWLTTRQA